MVAEVEAVEKAPQSSYDERKARMIAATIENYGLSVGMAAERHMVKRNTAMGWIERYPDFAALCACARAKFAEQMSQRVMESEKTNANLTWLMERAPAIREDYIPPALRTETRSEVLNVNVNLDAGSMSKLQDLRRLAIHGRKRTEEDALLTDSDTAKSE